MRYLLGHIYWKLSWVLMLIIFPLNWTVYKIWDVDVCPEFWFIDIGEWLEYKGIISETISK